jgi:LPXTG-motif cell wall-anchored protein
VNIEFIDYSSDGKTVSIKDTIAADGYEGQNFTVNPPATIGDYVYVGSSLDANVGTYTTNPQSVQLYYVHPKYTVEHVDENGKVLSTETFDKGLGLQEYTAKAKSFDGYKLSGAESQSVTLTKDNPDQKMVFVYKKQTKAATKTSASVAPATGDSTNISAMMLLGGLSLLSIVVIKVKKQKA